MKRFSNFLLIGVALTAVLHFNCDSQDIYYVGNGGDWHNWDIYSYNIGTSTEIRLTTSLTIDNHPVISHYNPNRIAWSANRDNPNFFDIYVADISNIEGTLVRLTDDSYPGAPGQGAYEDRHPHWHPNGDLLIFTSKNQLFEYPILPTTTCSQPEIKKEYYERMNIIELTPAGTAVASYTELDIVSAWDQKNDPGIWVITSNTYVGHPSFSHQGDEIVFTAAIDGEGKNWEVYVVGFDPVGIGLLPNSLRRVTYGPDLPGNPIKMSGGASFSYDDSQIIFNSTRVGRGNSQIFSVPAGSTDIPVNEATQLTFHRGNDYVPEQLADGSLIIVSDRGPGDPCGLCETGPGATLDLDVVHISGGERTILGTDAYQQTVLIADEVSWFCGTKPNLAGCTFVPRIMNVESLWLEAHPFDLLPPDILSGYGPDYFSNGQFLYSMGWGNLETELGILAPDILANIYTDMNALWAYNTPPWPGYSDPTTLQIWLDGTNAIRNKKYVVPVYMGFEGLLSYSPIVTYLNHISIPSGCAYYDDGLQDLYTSAPPPGYYSGSPPWGSFTMFPGASAYLTAGCRIKFLPGTIIPAGAYLSGYILPYTPPFCVSSGPVIRPSEKITEFEDSPVVYSNPQLRFKIYPNPATKSFWIELLDEEDACHVQIEVYNFTGHKLWNQNRKMVKRTKISLPDQSPGPYMVKVTKGDLSGNQTVILN